MDGKVRGFTLLELLVVIIILSIIVTVAIISSREYWISSSLKEASNKIATDLSYIKSLSVATDSVWVLCFIDYNGDGNFEAYRIIGDRNANLSFDNTLCNSTDSEDIVYPVEKLPRITRVVVSPNTRIIGFSKKGTTLISSSGSYANFGVRIEVISTEGKKINQTFVPAKKKTIRVNRLGRITSE